MLIDNTKIRETVGETGGVAGKGGTESDKTVNFVYFVPSEKGGVARAKGVGDEEKEGP